MESFLTSAFALICGQHAAHTWAPGGLLLPCCQRCTGLYVGAAGALLLHALCRPQPTTRWQWVQGMFLLQMVPFGFHWLPQSPVLRTLTGVLFGFGLVAFLWPLAANLVTQISNLLRRQLPTEEPLTPSPARGLATRDIPDSKSAPHPRHAAYALGLGATLLLVPVLAAAGGRFGFLLLSWLAALGALTLAGLVLLNLAALGQSLLAAAARQVGRRGRRPSERRVPA